MTTYETGMISCGKGKRDPSMAPGLSKFATTTSTFLRKVADGTSTKDEWNAFYVKYRDTLKRHAIERYGASPADADDAVQKVFESLWRCPQTIRRHPNSRFRFWLVCALKYKLYNFWRDEERQRGNVSPVDVEQLTSDYYTLEAQIKRAFYAFLRQDLYDQLRIGRTPHPRLKRRTFEIWYERVYNGRGRDETAAMYGVDPWTVTDSVKKVNQFLEANRDDLFREFQMV